AMEELGYRRNRFARGLRTRRSGVIGMLIQDHENPFYAEIVQHAEQILRRRGFDLVASSSNTDVDTEAKVIDRLSGMQVDGMIVSVIDYDRIEKTLSSIQKQGIYCVVAGVDSRTAPFDTVTIRIQRAMKDAMNYLYDMGHRKIGFVRGAPSFQGIGGLFDIYREFLVEKGSYEDGRWVRHCGFHLEDGHEAALDLLSEADRPTAIFALNDVMAIASIRAAHSLGVQVPKDLSVIGVDDIKWASYFCPSLTTISQPITRYAEMLCELVVDGITRSEGRTDRGTESQGSVPEKKHKVFHGKFVIRESVAKAPE
ncbi:MAG: LacI family DNA-binding transcriptional regulator, partial [Puniceicoccales bacterium]